ncbi:Ada metal-binding domain-containing protein [uncultured Methanobrevibacter sp.]|uniref:Ada metal-binding domain-containing protein n=1 Tax=uncultured Methanobrevibacter sp. TaxID=253161 RepID=UPI0025CD22EB|nr:Ada metal-binding domain-containing protein [uncultured Methanobrevibacter sp.]
MNKNILLAIAIVSALICVSPIVAAENNAFHDYALYGLKFLGGDSHDNLTVNDLKIEKVKTEHTDSNGKTDKKTDYFLKFKVKSDANSFGNYSVKIDCLDKNKKSIKTVDSYVDKEGNIKIPLSSPSAVASANVTITDSDGHVLYQNVTSKIKTSENITKDKPVEKTKTSSSSSGSTFWASSNSDKFHKPSCEWAQKISSKNKVVFHSKDEALNAGYSPCSVCNP